MNRFIGILIVVLVVIVLLFLASSRYSISMVTSDASENLRRNNALIQQHSYSNNSNNNNNNNNNNSNSSSSSSSSSSGRIDSSNDIYYTAKYLSSISNIAKRIFGSAYNSTVLLFNLNEVSSNYLVTGILPQTNATNADIFKYDVTIRTRYAKKGVNNIWQGSYLVQLPLAMIAYLSKVQYRIGVHGSVGEIGVHGGMFFIGLAHLSFKNETLWACDVFEQQDKNVDGSGFGDKTYFLQQCQSNDIDPQSISLFVGSSAEIDPKTLQASGHIKPFRLISVDGGHTRQLTINDLIVAASNLVEGGIIILDDVLNFDQWPGVIDGMFTWLATYKDEFGPFFVGNNKVLLCHRKYHGLYYQALLSHDFWSKYLSEDPASNHNIHKSKSSGTNYFSWGGYKYLFLAPGNTPALNETIQIWIQELS